MATTRKPPSAQPETARPAGTNGPAGDVLTLAEAAAYLRVSEAAIVELFHSQNLPGRLIGSEWRFLKAALQQWLASGTPSPPSRKEAQLALAGKYRDDPDLQRICDDAYRRRARTQAEDE